MENSASDFFGFWAASTLISSDNKVRSSYDFMADWTPSQDIKAGARSNEYLSDWR